MFIPTQNQIVYHPNSNIKLRLMRCNVSNREGLWLYKPVDTQFLKAMIGKMLAQKDQFMNLPLEQTTKATVMKQKILLRMMGLYENLVKKKP